MAAWSSPDPAVARFPRELPSPIGEHPLDTLLSAERARTLRQVLARRVTRLAAVIEDCYDPHNATAIMRSCDAYGVHRVHVTTSRHRFKVNRRVSQGAHHWLDLRVHDHVREAYDELRRDGYAILVSDLHAARVHALHELPPLMAAAPLAVVFGSEGLGVSDDASRLADGCFRIPMVGMTQSLNLSVSVAVTLHGLRGAALAADEPGDLDAASQRAWYERWIRRQRGEAVDAVLARARRETDRKGEELDSYGS